MAVSMIGPKFYAWDREGNPLAFGKVYTYKARTNAPQVTYQSEDAVVANTNPVILNGEGYGNIYLDGSYKVVVKDKDDNEIWTADPVTAQGGEEWVNCMTATYLSSTTFKISGNVTDKFDTGRRIRIDNNADTYSYSTILSAVFAATDTTITITDAVVTTGIVNACVSIIGSESTPGIARLSYNTLQLMRDDPLIAFLSDGDIVKTNGHSIVGKGGLEYFYNAADTTSSDNDGTLIVIGAMRFQSNAQVVYPEEFGSLGDGGADDTALIKSCIASGTAAINNKHKISEPFLNVDSALTAVTLGDAIRGCTYLDENGVFHKKLNQRKSTIGVIKADSRRHFPFDIVSSLTSVSNTTSGSDSDGSFYETSDNALDSATNQILVTASSENILRFQYKGNIQNKFVINFFEANGTYISNIVVYSGSSGDATGITEVSEGLKELYLTFTTPANAGKYNVELENYTGRSYKIYGVESVISTLASKAMLSSVGADFKGFSAFKLNGEFNWAASSSLSFEKILQELIWIKNNFNVSSIRMWMGLDGGMVKDGAGVYQSFTDAALINWDRFFIAAELLGISVVPCLLCPIKSDYGHPINMDRRAMTDNTYRDAYGVAVKFFINRYKMMENIIAWDVINEPYFMLSNDGTNSYTATQITAVVEYLNDQIKEVSTLPKIISLADGSSSVYGIQTLDTSKIEAIDFHSYGSFLRYSSIGSIARIPVIMNEIGGSDLGNPSQTVTQVKDILQDAAGNAGTAWIWESYVRGGTSIDYMTITNTELQQIYKSMQSF